MVEKLGYSQFFMVTALLGIPTLLLILWQWRQPAEAVAEPAAPASNGEHSA